MRKALLVLCVCCMTTFAYAERFTDVIDSFSSGDRGKEHLLYLKSGRVVFVKPSFALTKADFRPGQKIELITDRNFNLVSVTSLQKEEKENVTSSDDIIEEEVPTVLPDLASANKIFQGMNRFYKSKSECTDRAQVWAYEEWRKHNLISRKVFLFFTDTYIRRYRFGWWFHVSPYTFVNENESPVEYVMDRRFTKTPYLMKNWTDVFIRSRKNCPEETYRHYRTNRRGPEHCFIVKSAMYYRLPLHVRNLEDSGIKKTKFSINEVNFSYRAFNRRGVK